MTLKLNYSRLVRASYGLVMSVICLLFANNLTISMVSGVLRYLPLLRGSQANSTSMKTTLIIHFNPAYNNPFFLS